MQRRQLTKTINVSTYKIILAHVYRHVSALVRTLHRLNTYPDSTENFLQCCRNIKIIETITVTLR